MNSLIYIINDITYSKDEILTDDTLKKQYLDILKNKEYNEKAKIRMRKLRKDEYYKEQNRIKNNKRYAEDVEYRTKKLERARERKHKEAIKNNKPIRGRGRPPIYTLNDNLEISLIN